MYLTLCDFVHVYSSMKNLVICILRGGNILVGISYTCGGTEKIWYVIQTDFIILLSAYGACVLPRGACKSWLDPAQLARRGQSCIKHSTNWEAEKNKQTLMYFLQIAYEGCHVSWRICVCAPTSAWWRWTSVKVARAEMQNDQICVCPNADCICASSCLAAMFSGRALLFVIGS